MSIFRDTAVFLRTQFVDAMEDSATIRKPGQGWNTSTNTYETSPAQTYTGACLLRPMGETDRDFAEELAQVSTHILIVPHDAGPLGPDEEITIDSIGGALNPQLVGAKLTIRGIRQDSYNARQRIYCELNRGGGAS